MITLNLTILIIQFGQGVQIKTSSMFAKNTKSENIIHAFKKNDLLIQFYQNTMFITYLQIVECAEQFITKKLFCVYRVFKKKLKDFIRHFLFHKEKTF